MEITQFSLGEKVTKDDFSAAGTTGVQPAWRTILGVL